MTRSYKPLSHDEAMDVVGREDVVTAYYATGDKLMDGTVIAYSIVPQVLIENEDGHRRWWRRDMVALEATVPEIYCLKDSDGVWWVSTDPDKDVDLSYDPVRVRWPAFIGSATWEVPPQ